METGGQAGATTSAGQSGQMAYSINAQYEKKGIQRLLKKRETEKWKNTKK